MKRVSIEGVLPMLSLASAALKPDIASELRERKRSVL